MTLWENYKEEWRKELVDNLGLSEKQFKRLFEMGRPALEYFYEAYLHTELLEQKYRNK